MDSAQKASLVLDMKGLLCPMPVMRTSQAIRQLKLGDVLEVLATDPGSKPDLTAWTRMTGNELVSVAVLEGSPKTYRFQIRRLK